MLFRSRAQALAQLVGRLKNELGINAQTAGRSGRAVNPLLAPRRKPSEYPPGRSKA